MKKKNVAVLFGGKSVEHEVSIESAKTVCVLLGKAGLRPLGIYVDRKGAWRLSAPGNPFPERAPRLVLDPGTGILRTGLKSVKSDCFFPLIHGTTGEDGIVQGLLEAAGTPYVGCGVKASAIGMDKVLSKKLASEHGVPVLPHVIIDSAEKGSFERGLRAAVRLPFPVFVKPVSLGSSVGVTKVKAYPDLDAAARRALRFDENIMIEAGVDRAREIVVGVLGGRNEAAASVCGEVRPKGKHEFYDYEAKYLDENGIDFLRPAPLGAAVSEQLRRFSLDVFRALDGFGMARMDFFVPPGGGERAFFGEVNTVPGFTSHSLYPGLWAASGLAPEQVVKQLVDLALLRHRRKSRLKIFRK